MGYVILLWHSLSLPYNYIKRTLTHVHRVCDVYVVYVNLVLKKEKYILGRIGLNFGGFGEQLN